MTLCLAVAGGNDKNAVVFNKDTEQVIAILQGHSKKVTSVIYHPQEVLQLCAPSASCFDRLCHHVDFPCSVLLWLCVSLFILAIIAPNMGSSHDDMCDQNTM